MYKSSYIAEKISGKLIGEDVDIKAIGNFEDSKPGEITWAEDEKKLEKALMTKASCIITGSEKNITGKTLIKVENPRFAFLKLLEMFSDFKELSGISKNAFIDKSVKIDDSVSVGPMAVIMQDAVIGMNVKIHSNVYIGNGAVIGDNTVIWPNAVIMDKVILGKNVIIYPGAVIGSDGFGYVKVKDKHLKMPQIGTVLIQDNVEVGANTCIDRATVGSTKISSGTKIDNMVHIAHNVEVGVDCIIVAFTGIAGSCKIGDRVVLAAQTGVGNHASVGNDVVALARTGVTKNIPSGSYVSGNPAVPHNKRLRLQAFTNQLPDLIKK
jgi:UDP-3-O-[3-hydroxymyristoyl] glucosamine N-acyltransferase